jgi:hypothetical protein
MVTLEAPLFRAQYYYQFMPNSASEDQVQHVLQQSYYAMMARQAELFSSTNPAALAADQASQLHHASVFGTTKVPTARGRRRGADIELLGRHATLVISGGVEICQPQARDCLLCYP